MDSQVGTVLRKARGRRKIELAEVEEATRIRVRYLRALENEEWDVLPGGVYTRGFIRTYASFLGLDGARLAEDYRSSVEADRATEAGVATTPAPERAFRQRRRVPAAGWLATAAAILVAAVVIVSMPNGGGEEDAAPARPQQPAQAIGRGVPSHATANEGVSMRLAATAEVWVCILDAGGKQVVDGLILDAGAEEGPFHSGSFTVSLGNGEVSMLIDGKKAEIPTTSSPIGYSIDETGSLTELGETERPTCT